VRISIEINNSAGDLSARSTPSQKMQGSGLEPYLEFRAFLTGEEEKRLFREFTL
jgi:metal-dependent HD superfamily phosphatase/phosphodiesterase